jgi:hypothetical protein
MCSSSRSPRTLSSSTRRWPARALASLARTLALVLAGPTLAPWALAPLAQALQADLAYNPAADEGCAGGRLPAARTTTAEPAMVTTMAPSTAVNCVSVTTPATRPTPAST